MKNGDKKRALVVDNDEHALAAFQASLENAGFDTEATWSGREALSALESGLFDLLLVDGYLPDLHVTEFLDRIGRLEIQLVIVVMQSEVPKPRVVRRYRSLGSCAVVDKRDPAEVRRTVAACCSSRA